MSTTVSILKLRRGGRAVRITTRHMLTRYDLIGAAIYAMRQERVNPTKKMLSLYVRRMLENSGIESIIAIYNDAKQEEIAEAQDAINRLFPRL